jgi:hypothetical protein
MRVLFFGMDLLIHEGVKFGDLSREVLLELVRAVFKEDNETQRRKQKNCQPEDFSKEGHERSILRSAPIVNRSNVVTRVQNGKVTDFTGVPQR